MYIIRLFKEIFYEDKSFLRLAFLKGMHRLGIEALMHDSSLRLKLGSIGNQRECLPQTHPSWK